MLGTHFAPSDNDCEHFNHYSKAPFVQREVWLQPTDLTSSTCRVDSYQALLHVQVIDMFGADMYTAAFTMVLVLLGLMQGLSPASVYPSPCLSWLHSKRAINDGPRDQKV